MFIIPGDRVSFLGQSILWHISGTRAEVFNHQAGTLPILKRDAPISGFGGLVRLQEIPVRRCLDSQGIQVF